MEPGVLPYWMVGGVAAISLVIPAIIGGDAWYVPLIVIPLALVYLLVDRRLKHRDE
jgi:hypothetical protein